MGDKMTGNEQDVPFDFGVAASLAAACDAAAGVVEGQRSTRLQWAASAGRDFRGHFSELFKQNVDTADIDAGDVVAALRATATSVRKLIEDAHEEQTRRVRAREWKQHHDHRGIAGWIDDHFGDGDDIHIEHTEQMSYAPPPPTSRPRHTPPPGSGGGTGGGTSSARPEDLTTFASHTAAADETLASRPAALRSDYQDFQARCQWGTLNADGVFAGFSAWLRANGTDAAWARTVAAAFARAGGQGAVSTLPNSAIESALRAAGVRDSRTDLDITMPSALGHPPTTGFANDPVNTATGNFIETESDLEFLGASGSLGWRRSYNSVTAGVGAFGPGWSSWCEAGLTLADDGASFTFPDGRSVAFPRRGDGWDRAVGENLWLAREDDLLVVSDNDGGRWVHEPSGRLLRSHRGLGSTVSLTWADDRLTGLSHERGRSLALEWSGDRVAAVVASDGRRIAYAYDAGRLVTATGPLGTRSYRWNDAGLISAVVDADGVVEAENAYDEHGRVVRQRSPFGRVTRFVYLPGRTTVVSDEDGRRSNTWIADARGRLIGVVDADERRQSTAYDAHGNPVMTTDRGGSTTISEYDARGRRTRQVSPDGADVRVEFDDLDRAVRVTVSPEVGTAGTAGTHDAGGVDGTSATTTYTYADDSRHPATVTGPEGGVTRLEWADGLLRRVTDPMGVPVALEYDEHGDLVASTDALGHTARLERDAAGRVTAAVTPLGHRTSFKYAADSGLMVARTDPDGARWTYEYTAAGRLVVMTDPLGGRTTLERGAHGEESATIDALGRALRRVHDDLGFVAATELPDGTRWEYTHDALGRVTEVLDPAGGVRRTEYDAVGEPAAVTDPTGLRLEMRDAPPTPGTGATLALSHDLAQGDGTRLDVDRLGRLVSETGPDGSVRLTRYDRCSRVVETVDAAGGVTRLERDAAGRVVTLVRPGGAEVGYAYDACGRLEVITDETGAAARRVHDADGRVVVQHLPTGEVAESRFDACGRVVAMRVPGVGTTTYSYDLAGRLVETRDPVEGRRRFRYDAAGQLVRAEDGNGGATAYDYDGNGRCVAITHPDGGVTRREYDALNKVVAETDPLGRTTRAGYDAAGRPLWQSDPGGSRTEWRYDDRGRLASTWVDGVEQSAVERDLPGRRVRITDRSGAGGAVAVHELTYDERGLLVSRTRDGRGPSWEYDADGACVALTAPDGTRTGYVRDAGGRLVGVDHPLLGRVVIERDATGRMTRADAPGLTQRWTYRDGFVAGHEVDGPASAAGRTEVTRDEDGRVVRVTRVADGRTEEATFGHDEAGQLVAAATAGPDGTHTLRWRYDAAGRMVAESADGTEREWGYDRAGQLLLGRVDGAEAVRYAYDAAGRRVEETHADGRRRAFRWSPTGYLAAVDTTDGRGRTERVEVVVDATGELARVDGAEAFVDSRDPRRRLLALGDRQLVDGGACTGTIDRAPAAGGADGGWAAAGWRDARVLGPDPWTLPTEGLPEQPGPGTGYQVTPTGDLLVAGLEWMGHRVYDPGTHGFLSVDPRDPTTGAGWAGNPYSYAGNDPLHALDPLGLHPVTDAELAVYNSHNSVNDAIANWTKENWEYVVGGAMVVGGIGLMFVPGGQALGLGLASAGADALIQKATTGEVNWKEVAISGALGTVGGVGGGIAAKAGLTGFKAAAAAGAIDGAWQGGVAGGAGYMVGPGPHTVSGLVETTATGTVFGAGTGGAFSSVAHGATALRHLHELAPVPPPPTAPGKELVPYWPANRGAAGDWESGHLLAGTRIDRYGHPGGTFVSPEGTPYPMRALPPGSDARGYHVYEVVKPIPVQTSRIAPAFGEIGGGVQHELPMSAGKLLDHGILREIK